RCSPALGGLQEDRSRIRRGGACRRRHRRRDQSSRRRHQGQFAHADAGQEQRRDRRRDPEVAGWQGAGGMSAIISKGVNVMRGVLVSLVAVFAASAAVAQTKEPVLLRDMGSFHVGGRVIEISGQPIKEVVFTPGGVPAKVDPNGAYQVEQMY